MKQWEIAVIPGEGIGKEVVPAALDVLKTIADVHGGCVFVHRISVELRLLC